MIKGPQSVIIGAMSIGKRIKENREKKGWSQPVLAKACGWGRGSRVSNYEAGVREPRLAEIKTISDALGLESPIQLVQDEFNISFDDNKIPIRNFDGEEIIGEVTPPFPVSRSSYALKIQDDSMRNFYEHHPTFPAGTVIIVDPALEAAPGKYVIAREKESPDATPIFRRYIVSTAGKKLMPLNGALYDKEDADNFDIIGVVVASMNLDL